MRVEGGRLYTFIRQMDVGNLLQGRLRGGLLTRDSFISGSRVNGEILCVGGAYFFGDIVFIRFSVFFKRAARVKELRFVRFFFCWWEKYSFIRL